MELHNTYVPSLPVHRLISVSNPPCLVYAIGKDSTGKYACYMGIAHLPNPSHGIESYEDQRKASAEWILLHGNKLDYEAARLIFGVSEAEYRR